MNALRLSGAVAVGLVLVLEAARLDAGEPGAVAAAKPENLARSAKVSASTAFSDQYLGQFACDGQVPAPGSAGDVGKAWAARGNDHPEGAVFTLEWPEPVSISEVVYYGRTAFAATENWRDYEIRLDDGPVVLKGALAGGHGPQRMTLPQLATARKLAIRFVSSWGGPNPGAAEIEVYAARIADASLGAFIPAHKLLMDGSGPPPPPTVEESAELAGQLKAGRLGFTKLVVAQRHHIRSSHVYTYHCEGQRDGGGLFVYDVAGGNLTRLVDSPDGQMMGRQDLQAMRAGAMDPAGLPKTRRGQRLGLVGTLLSAVPIVFLVVQVARAIADEL